MRSSRAGGAAFRRQQTAKAGAVAFLVEPLEHLVELLAQRESRDDQREAAEHPGGDRPMARAVLLGNSGSGKSKPASRTPNAFRGTRASRPGFCNVL
jgi:hypothetical protein